MGNNVYETPRNKSKWHTTTDKGHQQQAGFGDTNDKMARLQKLKEKAKQQKDKTQH